MKILLKKRDQKPIVRFLVCGAQKAGTTALSEYLREHPQVYIPDRKEVHYFDDESLNWGRPNHSRYHKFFQERGQESICGEATPIYMYWDSAPLRIWKYNSEMRIIVLLRNPITRAYSHWSMEKSRGLDTADFSDAIAKEEMRCKEALPLQHRVFSYIDRGFYTHQIRRLWRLFGRERVLVLRQDELNNEPQKTINSVCDHLGVDRMVLSGSVYSNVGTYSARMRKEDHALLVSLFSPEIRQLEDLLGWDCGSWLVEHREVRDA